MSFNIDSAIFIGFLVINLVVGLFYGRGVKTIKDYALGGRNFSTTALVSTIIATWIGGDYLFITMAEVYTTGLHYTIGCLGMVVCLLLNAYLFIPRMGEFLGSISVASAMGDLYGKHVRLITAIGGTIASAGFIAVQFKVFGYILNNFVGLPGNSSIFLAASIVILYSAVGGIRSVTFTDIVQFFTFGVLIPVLGIVVWNDYSSLPNFDLKAAFSHPLFNYQEFLGFSNPKFWSLISLFILFSLPDLNPTMFQRVAIGRTVNQVKRAFSISAVVLMLILLGMAWIAFLLFNVDPSLEPTNLVQYIINTYSHTGLKSFIIIGVVAMCMSTADSNINASSVLLTHDFCAPLNIKFKSELFLSKIISIILGLVSIFLALLDYDLLPLVFMTQSFYIPIIDVPLILAILGFRSTPKAVLIGMGAGFLSVIIWRMYFMDTGVDSILPGTAVNLIFFLGSHYLLGQKGGWISPKKVTSFSNANPQHNGIINRIIKPIKEFNLIVFCKNNSPKNELTYTGFGVFCTISTICTMYSITNTIGAQNKGTILHIYESMLILSVCFMTYPIWPSSLKKDIITQIAWNFGIVYLLIFCSSFFLMLSNFGQLQLIVFIINIIVAAILTKWKLALAMITAGSYLSLKAYKCYANIDRLDINMTSTSLIIYTFLLSGAAIVIFLKPKQEYQDLTEEKNEHLSGRIEAKDREVQEALALKSEFIRNVNHEYHTPMTGVISVAESLQKAYDKLTEEQKKNAIDVIVKSAHSLKALDENIATLARLSKPHYELKKEYIDFSGLVMTRVQICRKLYEENEEDRKFIFDVEDRVIVNADKTYMIQLLDNLIINSIKYCKKGNIKLILSQNKEEVSFVISDEGIGIPVDEIFEIFKPFTVSSRTKTQAGGRGVGLTLCQRIAEVHDGSIKAESNGNKGATFIVRLPR